MDGLEIIILKSEKQLPYNITYMWTLKYDKWIYLMK